jgi:predicted aconitase
LCGEGVATEQYATKDCHPEYWRLPNLYEEDLKKVGGALSTLGNIPMFHEDPDPISGLLA